MHFCFWLIISWQHLLPTFLWSISMSTTMRYTPGESVNSRQYFFSLLISQNTSHQKMIHPLRLSFLYVKSSLSSPFFSYRIIGWLKVSISLWSDGLSALKNGTAEQYRPGKSYVLVTFLLVNALLGSLQVLWSFEILKAAAKILGE
mmetsp:Transcript_11513/g.17108  ORF Transcript_11513/g.17108 Transcript_11513/m.17108 type:complete len:146 (+) Transcript_11513:18-455(+)